MSSFDRLIRLGLSHLADQPERLAQALEAALRESEVEEAQAEAEMIALRKELGIAEVADEPRRSATGLRTQGRKGR